MPTATADPTVSEQVKDLRAQIELALLQRIQASVQSSTPAELAEMLRLYAEVIDSDWYRKRNP